MRLGKGLVEGSMEGSMAGLIGEAEEEDLVDSMRALDIAHFAEVRPLL